MSWPGISITKVDGWSLRALTIRCVIVRTYEVSLPRVWHMTAYIALKVVTSSQISRWSGNSKPKYHKFESSRDGRIRCLSRGIWGRYPLITITGTAKLSFNQVTAMHYSNVIMSTMAAQTPSPSIVCSTVCSGVDQRKHESAASLAFVRGIHRWPVNSPHKGPITRKMLPFDDVIMACKDRESIDESTGMLSSNESQYLD